MKVVRKLLTLLLVCILFTASSPQIASASTSDANSVLGTKAGINQTAAFSSTSTTNVDYLFEVQEHTSTSSGYKVAWNTLQQIAEEAWMTPTHFIVEVPSEMRVSGTNIVSVKWQQVSLDFENSASSLFPFVLVNNSNNAQATRTGRVMIASNSLYTQIKMDIQPITQDAPMPAPRRVWLAQNSDRIDYLFETYNASTTHEDSGYKLALTTLQGIRDELWVSPTHFIIEVPAELWMQGAWNITNVRWQQIAVNFEANASSTFSFMTVNIANGAQSVKTGRITVSEYNDMLVIQIDVLPMTVQNMPAPGRIWLEYTADNVDYLFTKTANTTTSSGFLNSAYNLDGLVSEAWLLATHFVVEVPAEIWTSGSSIVNVRWQKVRVDFVYGATSTYSFVTINTANGAHSVRTGTVSVTQSGAGTRIALNTSPTGQAIMPAPNSVWLVQNQ